MFRKTVTVFSSLKLTIGILLSMGGLIGYATFFEVDPSSGAIRRDFYRTPGFLGILVMLGVNLAACTAKRAPYRPHQVGYVTTHGGLMMILAGSILTFAGGVEGILPLSEKAVSPAEATRETFYRTDAPPDLELTYLEGAAASVLGRFPVAPAIAAGGDGSIDRLGWILFLMGVIVGVLFLLRIWEKGDWYRPVPFLFLALALVGCVVRVLRPPQGELPRFAPAASVSVSVAETLPHARATRSVRGDGAAENPAVRVEIEMQGAVQENRWLFEREPGRSHFRAGPLVVAFVPADDLAGIHETIARESQGALARLVPGATPAQVQVKEAREKGGWHPLGEGLSVRVDAFFADLAVDPEESDPDERFTSKGDSPNAPAVLFYARRGVGEGGEAGTLFLARPGAALERVSGDLPIPEGIEFRFDPRAYMGYRLPMVLLARQASDVFGWLCTGSSGDALSGTARAGEPFRYPFMPMPLFIRVAEAFDRAREEAGLVADPSTDAPPGLRVRIEREGRIREAGVLLDGEPAEVFFGGEPSVGFRLEYKRPSAPLGFTVTLDDFRKVDYPGTERASSYESDVTLVDGPVTFPTVVKVNHPLIHEGFRLFQSSYMTDGRGREISVFAVARDPGARLVYLGFLVFGIGLVLIFYLKPILLEREKLHHSSGGKDGAARLSCPKCGHLTRRGGFARWQYLCSILLFPIGLVALFAGRRPTVCESCGFSFQA